jgi:Protein of unknown function (DUF5818)
MKKSLLTTVILVLGASWAVAQSSTSQQPDKSQTGTSHRSGHTFTGCVSGSAGTYTLTDASGNTYQIAGDTSKVADHVGQQVQITGGESPGAPGEASSGATSGPAGAANTIFVKKVKKISSSCPSK